MAQVMMVKDGIASALTVFQRINVSLLKLRTILQSGDDQISNQVLTILLLGAAACIVVPLIVPGRVIATFLVLQVFSAYFDFRQYRGPATQSTGHKFMRWWLLIPVPAVKVTTKTATGAAAPPAPAKGAGSPAAGKG
eukprot:TRINITY_DN9233_c0_g3_i1.p2 TRINITY_DN9233_c0_g3~~TRINITY_DN9233_c0_g3_i1.p2  ORF type:complete len:153 (-),score=11.98 TRINITY_DN9233_c0_g3_i1:130-540(-)